MASTVLAGRYELGQPLGQGGMATVYEAHDALLDRSVAVKLLRVDGEATARQRFAAEARAAASLTHPHAVAVYDVSSGDDQPFIVMELVRGGTLEDVLHDGERLTTPQVVAVGSQVLAALHAAHRRGLVHRDVKPANILLPDGVVPSRPDELPGVKLADFGIAKATRDATVGLTMAGQVIGTPRYLSPEQVRGQRATPRSDLYATAIVLYEMLAGHPPFEHDSAVGLALAHREDEPPPLTASRADVDPDLVALIHRALAKDPDERPADAAEMREALLRSGRSPSQTRLLPGPAAGTQHAARPEPTRDPPVAPPARRRPRLLWWAVVLALLAVVGVLAVQLATQSPAPTDEPTAQPQAPAVEAAPDGEQPDAEQPAEQPDAEQPAEQPDAEQPDPAPDEPQPEDEAEPQPTE
ncbi:MAG: protein kinase [Actinobacteria bacterium]|nr:protein kinase [Actinomycetota bacterium]